MYILLDCIKNIYFNTKQNQIEEYFSSDFSQGTLPSVLRI